MLLLAQKTITVVAWNVVFPGPLRSRNVAMIGPLEWLTKLMKPTNTPAKIRPA